MTCTPKNVLYTLEKIMPSTHQFGVRTSIFPFIKNGRKTLEVRVADEKRKRVKRDDLITFNHEVTRKVVRICGYLSFEEMLEHEDPEQIIPGWTKAEILNDLRETYTKEKEDLGVLVFQLQVDP